MQEVLRTEVVHIVDCPEGPVCPAQVRVEGLVGEQAIVGREPVDGEVPGPGESMLMGRHVLDPAVARALRQHIGPGEGARIVPDALLDAIRSGEAYDGSGGGGAAGADASPLIVPDELLHMIRKGPA